MPTELTGDVPAAQTGTSALQLRAMFSQAAVGIAIANLEGTFVEANERACALFGYAERELRGKTFLELTHPDDVARTRDQAHQLLAGRIDSYVLEKRYVRRDGSEVWSNTTVTLLRNQQGNPDRYLGILQDIDDRKQADLVKNHLAAVVNSSDDAIVTKTLDGVITSWNPAAERMFGFTAKEAIGQPVTMLIPEDHLDEEPEILQRLRRGERIHHYETVRRRKDGTLFNVSLTVSPVKDGAGRVVGASKIARDITRQKQSETALREHAETLRLLVAAGQSIASGLRLEGILQRVTDLGTQMSGAQFGAFFHNVTDEKGESYQLYTLSGAPREAFEKFGMPRNTPLFNATFSGESVVRSDDITRDTRYGQWAPHRGMPPGHLPVRSYLAVPVLARSGEVLGGLFFGHSRSGVFTEQAEKLISGLAAQAAVAMDNSRLYEDAQREISHRERAEQRLREADRRKDEFLATLAHELRNPLAPIRQAAAVAGAAGSSEAQKRWGLEVIERQVRHMSALLNDLLDIARITRGAFDLRPARTTAGEVADAAIETAGPLIAAREHTLHTQIADRDAELVGDSLRLAQILANLLLNAAKYTDTGGTIWLGCTSSDSEVTFSVRDTGIGIPPEALPGVFAMFTQVHPGRARNEGGLGIGLALARGLVELHGGSIEARSEGAGRGSEFIVRLPRNLEAVTPEKPTLHPTPAAEHARRKVLIADDNEDAARTLAMLLEVSGHHVTVVHDGEEALRKVGEEHPDFALLDIGMPKLNGYEVARRLRREAGNPALTLIALTGWGQAADKARAIEAGFDLHFTKPVDPERILRLLDARP
jgi:PAS domain S-box-containing protein